MNKALLLLVTMGMVAAQGCSSGGTTPGETSSSSSSGTLSSSSSSSSSSSGASSSSSSSSSGQVDVGAAKTLVQDADVVVNFDFSDPVDSLGYLFHGETRSAYFDFRDEVYRAGLFNGEHPTHLLNAFAKVGGVITEALGANIEGTAVSMTEVTVDGVTAVFTPESIGVAGRGRRHTYVIQQIVDVCDAEANEDTTACMVDVDLVVVAEFGRQPTGSNGETSQLLNATDVTINFEGVLRNGYLLASIAPVAGTSHVSASTLVFESNEQVQQGWDKSSVTFVETENLSLNIPVNLSQLPNEAVISGLSITGAAAALTIELANNQKTETVDGAEVTTDDLRVSLLQMDDLVLTAASDVHKADESFEFVLGLAKPGSSVVSIEPYTLVTTVVETCPAGVETCSTKTDVDTANETAEDFLALEATIGFDAVLEAVGDFGIDMKISRESDDLLSLDQLLLASGDGSLTMSGIVDWYGQISELSASNGSGAQLIIEKDESGVRSGSITGMDGTVLGTVEDAGEEIKVNFSDGSVHQL